MAQATRPNADARAAGWLVFGKLVVERSEAERAENESRLRRWLAKLWSDAAPKVAHRDLSRLSASELRELGLTPVVGGPGFSSTSLTGLTLLSLAGR